MEKKMPKIAAILCLVAFVNAAPSSIPPSLGIKLSRFACDIKHKLRACGIYEDIKDINLGKYDNPTNWVVYTAKIKVDEWATLTIYADENQTVRLVTMHHKNIDNMLMGKKRTIPIGRVSLQDSGIFGYLEHWEKCYDDLNWFFVGKVKNWKYRDDYNMEEMAKRAYKTGKDQVFRFGSTCADFSKTGIDEMTTFFWHCPTAPVHHKASAAPR